MKHLKIYVHLALVGNNREISLKKKVMRHNTNELM